MREIWALWSRRGVLYLKPYLTAWINSPLFQCWAGAHLLLVLSFNNHTGFLSGLQCTVSYTEITNPGSTAAVRAHCTIILPCVLAWLRCLQFGYVSEYMSSLTTLSPFSNALLAHLLIFWNALHSPRTSHISNSIFITKSIVQYFVNFPYAQEKCERKHLGGNFLFLKRYFFNKELLESFSVRIFVCQSIWSVLVITCSRSVIHLL